MPSQIEIDIRANTNQAKQAVGQLSQEIQELQRQLKGTEPAGAGILTGASGTQYQVVGGKLQVVGQDFRKLKEEVEETGEAAKRTGINFEAMLERMAVRLVIFEAIRLAIQGVVYVLDEISKAQQAKIQFDALSMGVEHLEARFRMLKEAADKAMMPIDQAEKLRETLIDLGATEEQTVWLTRELGQWSHILGIDSERLAQALGHVAAGEGSLQEMRLVTRMMGDQREAGIQLINTYEGLERAQKALEAENKTVAQSMEAIVRTTEQMSERMERSRTRGGEFLKQAGITPGIEAQLPRLAALPPNLSVGYLQATGMLHLPQMPLGTSQIVLNQVQDMVNQYRAGLAAIQRQEGLSPQAMRALGPTLPVDYVMRAAGQAREDQLRDLREGDQADREHRAFMANQATAQTAAAKENLRTLPQAVSGPPAAVWDAWQGSIEGLKTQAAQDTDKLIDAWNKGIGGLSKSMDANSAATSQIVTILSGGT